MRRRKDRFPKLRRDADGKPLCRGCGAPVPKGRKSWCSTECYQERCPQEVIRRLYERDNGRCVNCGRNTNLEKRAYCLKLDALGFGSWMIDTAETKRLLRPVGMPRHRTDIWWHADHIKEFSDGGETILENMQTLCVPCHKEKTARWQKARAKARKNGGQLLLM